MPSAQRDNAEEISAQKEAADLLTADQTVPQSRIDFFQSSLSAEGFHHVGWERTRVCFVGEAAKEALQAMGHDVDGMSLANPVSD